MTSCSGAGGDPELIIDANRLIKGASFASGGGSNPLRSSVGEIVLFVSKSGNDNNPGTYDLPFSTIERARDEIRQRKQKTKGGLSGNVTVFIRGGTYRLTRSIVFTSEDSAGTSRFITYRSYENEVVRISGGIMIPAGYATKITDSEIFGELNEAEREHLLEVNLKKIGLQKISAFQWGRQRPKTQLFDLPAPEELFIDDQPTILARWPNSGWAKAGKIINSVVGSDHDQADLPTIRIPGGRLNRWIGTDVWLEGYWKWDWYDEALPIQSINLDNKTVTLGASHVYGFEKNRRYYVLNARSELDSPGEYYIDRENMLLYFWPKPVEQAPHMELSTLDLPLIIMRDASNITFEGITFETGRSTGIYIERGRNNTVRNCIIRNLGTSGITINGGHEHSVISSRLHNLGTQGIVVSGGKRETLTPANHTIHGNTIHHYGRRIQTRSPGIRIDGVGITVSKNHIYDAPHGGIDFLGNDHLIELNIIHNVTNETSDAGAIYAGRDWTSRGNIIKSNQIYNINGMDGGGDVTAIYLDDLMSGVEVIGNSIRNVHRGIFVGGGRDNTIRNNHLDNVVIPIQIDARGTREWAKHLLDKNEALLNRLSAMPYQNELWSLRYPSLANILSDEPEIPKYNVFSQNVILNSGATKIDSLARKYGTIKDNSSRSSIFEAISHAAALALIK